MTAPSPLIGTSKSKAATLRFVFLTLFSTIGVAMMASTLGSAKQLDLSETALLRAAEVNNLPLERLAVVNTAWLRKEIFRAKVLDKETGEIYLVSLHPSGKPATDEEVLGMINAELERGFVGKVQASLKERADSAPSESSRINIWVRTPEIPCGQWPSAIEQGRIEQVANEAARFHAQAEVPVIQFLHSLGIQEKYASQHAPVVTCEVRNDLLAKLESLPEIVRIYADGVAVPGLNTSIPTIKAQKVWQQGVTGSGVKVAIVEANTLNGTSAIANSNPFVGPVIFYDLTHTQPSRHATQVAGIIASTDVTYRGVSYGVARPADLLNGNPTDASFSNLNAATGWAAAQGASVINQSYRSCPATGAIGPMGLYDDYIVGLYLPTIAVCAGNSDCGLLVADPAAGYNVIAVGAFGHNSTSGWGDDFMADYSAFGNPGCPDHCREKPEIAAPGNIYSTFEVSPWVPSLNAGTSFAAPHVAGTAALLMQAKPSLKTAPEEVKAILMASAIHNIEGASRLSDKDGAGGLQAKAAYDVAVNSQSSYFRTCGPGPTCRSVTFSVTAGQTVRFAISWLSKSDPTTGQDTADDLDLTVKNPNGTVVATSASFDNNFEIVEFVAAQSGTYTARVCFKGYVVPEKVANFGWAYSRQ